MGEEEIFFFLAVRTLKERTKKNKTMSVYRLLFLRKKDVHKKFIKQQIYVLCTLYKIDYEFLMIIITLIHVTLFQNLSAILH